MDKICFDDSNPLVSLLNKSNVPTVLDMHFNQRIKKNSLEPKIHNESQVEASQDETEEIGPLIVFDGISSASDNENEPIGLNHRQPSFVSLHGQIIPKGGDSLADLQPVIEENNQKQGSEAIIDEDDEDDLQIKIVKHLHAANASRWASMGYEPPSDIIPMIRAKSQVFLTEQQGLNRNCAGSSSLVHFATLIDQKQPVILNTLPEESVDLPNLPTPIRRKRSGSFGMDIGEASASMELMDKVLTKDSKRETCDLSKSIIPSLYGNLSNIVDNNSILYRVLLDKKLPKDGDVKAIIKSLKDLGQKCIQNQYADEYNYVQTILESLSPESKSIISSRSHKGTKDTYILALKKLERDYLEEGRKVDEYFSNESVIDEYRKPSKELLELKSKEPKNAKQAKTLEQKIKNLEEKEGLESSRKLKDDYYEADKVVKEKYASRREIILRKMARSEPKEEEMKQSLKIKPIQLLNRNNDLIILHKMTDLLLKGKEINEKNIETIFSSTLSLSGRL